jgi:hypothetical protein
MPIPIKVSGQLAFSEIQTAVSESDGGGTASSLRTLSSRSLNLTSNQIFNTPDAFTDFLGAPPSGSDVISYTLEPDDNVLNLPAQFGPVVVPSHIRTVWGQGSPMWSSMGLVNGRISLLEVGYTHAQNLDKFAQELWCELVGGVRQANAHYYFNQMWYLVQQATKRIVDGGLFANDGYLGDLGGIYNTAGGSQNFGVNYSGVTRIGAISIGKIIGGNASVIDTPVTKPGTFNFPAPKSYLFIDEETYDRTLPGGIGFYNFVSGIFEGIGSAGYGPNVNTMFYGSIVTYFINANPNTFALTDATIQGAMSGSYFGDWTNASSYFDVSLGYYKTPGIETNSIYQKDVNNNYIISGGKRLYRVEDLTETYFGKTVTILKEPNDSIKYWLTNDNNGQSLFGAQYVNNPGTEGVTIKSEYYNAGYRFNSDHSQPYPSTWKPETRYFVEQVYRYANAILLGKRVLDNTETPSPLSIDISSVSTARRLKTGAVRRPRTEPFTTWGNSIEIREIGEQLLMFDVLFSILAGCQSYDLWDDGNTLNVLPTQGNPFDGRSENWSRYIVITAALQSVFKALEGTDPNTWKHIHFYYPFKGEQLSEIIGVGIYVGTKFVCNFFNPSLDNGEYCDFVLRAGNTSRIYRLYGQRNLFKVITVPAGLANIDFKLEYTNIYGVPIKVNGQITNTIADHYSDGVPTGGSTTTTTTTTTTTIPPTNPDKIAVPVIVGYFTGHGHDYINKSAENTATQTYDAGVNYTALARAVSSFHSTRNIIPFWGEQGLTATSISYPYNNQTLTFASCTTSYEKTQGEFNQEIAYAAGAGITAFEFQWADTDSPGNEDIQFFLNSRILFPDSVLKMCLFIDGNLGWVANGVNGWATKIATILKNGLTGGWYFTSDGKPVITLNKDTQITYRVNPGDNLLFNQNITNCIPLIQSAFTALGGAESGINWVISGISYIPDESIRSSGGYYASGHYCTFFQGDDASPYGNIVSAQQLTWNDAVFNGVQKFIPTLTTGFENLVERFTGFPGTQNKGAVAASLPEIGNAFSNLKVFVDTNISKIPYVKIYNWSEYNECGTRSVCPVKNRSTGVTDTSVLDIVKQYASANITQPTTTTTSTTTTTTTTTTTLSTVDFDISTSCGPDGSGITGIVTINNFRGGSGTYVSVSYGTTAAASDETFQTAPTTQYTKQNVSNGTIYVRLGDTSGNFTTKSIVVSCNAVSAINFTITTGCAGNGINGTGTVTVSAFSGGNGTYSTVAFGYSQDEAFNTANLISLNGNTAYQFTGLSNGAVYVILRDSFGNWFIKSITVICNNTTTTTTIAPTTTTLPPITISNSGVSCNGLQGSFQSFIGGGNGAYEWIAIADSQANAYTAVNGGGTRYTVNGNPYVWNGISNGVWFVAVRDSNGAVGVQPFAVSVECTTTTSTTTTTTMAPTSYFYLADRIECTTSNSAEVVVVANSQLQIGQYYSDNFTNAYYIKSSTGSTRAAINISNTTTYSSVLQACNTIQ